MPTVMELKKALKIKGLSDKGNKAELQTRLAEAEAEAAETMAETVERPEAEVPP